MKPLNGDAKVRRRFDYEPDLKELLDDAVIQIMMHYDGVSKSEMNEVIDQARARLSRKPNASEGAIIMKHRPCEGGRTDESKVGAEANGDVQPGSAPVGLPTLLAEERKKRSSPSQTSGQQCSEIAAAFKES